MKIKSSITFAPDEVIDALLLWIKERGLNYPSYLIPICSQHEDGSITITFV